MLCLSYVIKAVKDPLDLLLITENIIMILFCTFSQTII